MIAPIVCHGRPLARAVATASRSCCSLRALLDRPPHGAPLAADGRPGVSQPTGSAPASPMSVRRAG
jgi:hypothetical protein